MTAADDVVETILVVDDEEPVRRTFREWLDGADLGCRVLAAGDAATALALADRHPIDLAILDWNLGAGHDGLQLLEDLTLFHPDVVAILVTGFANQATPLMAMRMGVRDYLDKNHDLDRPTFLAAVRKQLERIRPARRERRLNRGLAAFRAAVEQVLPLVQAASALHDPVPLPTAIRSLFAFLLRSSGARDGALLVHSYDAERSPAEHWVAYDAAGQAMPGPLAPFPLSIAGSVVSLQEPHVLDDLPALAREGTIELQPFERGRQTVLAAPVRVASGIQVVLELFDRQDADGQPLPFGAEQRRLAAAAADFGGELLRQALAERQTNRLLLDAVAAALQASNEVSQTLGHGPSPLSDPPPAGVLEQLRSGLANSTTDGPDAAATLRLAEAVRVLALRYGPRAVEHCTRLVEDLGGLLDDVSGATGEAGA